MHDETYRMLGREHELDLEREARNCRRAAHVRGSRRERLKTRVAGEARGSRGLARSRIGALLLRLAHAGG